MKRIFRYYRTLRHLRPIQFYGRLWFKLYRPKPEMSPAPELRALTGVWQSPACRAPSMTGPGEFLFLGQGGSLHEHGWDGTGREKLWRYNQHYFDDLNARNAPDRLNWHRPLIENWIQENPPGSGNAWEPYPVSLRIVNWIKWALAGNFLSKAMQTSLAVQARWLSRRLEWHLLGNHLFVNAKALVFSGLFFEGAEAERWLRVGTQILAKQIPEQILKDGGQFELSPMYHALCVEDMLDLVNVSQAFSRQDLLEKWHGPIENMLHWLRVMSHPDGAISFFNDAAFGVAPDNEELFSYASRLGVSTPKPVEAICYLRDSGYLRLTEGPAVLLADLAPVGPDYLPGHAHADTLSFELSLAGKRLIVNSGTSVYGSDEERQRQRGTAAHSTLVIDGENSSEIWSGFRVGRRARTSAICVNQAGHHLVAGGQHSGYRHLAGSPVHQRYWNLHAGGLTVTDTVGGRGRHELQAHYFLAPGYTLKAEGDDMVVIGEERGRAVASVTVFGARLSCMQTTWHPSFGRVLSNNCLQLSVSAVLPHEIQTRFCWNVL